MYYWDEKQLQHTNAETRKAEHIKAKTDNRE
jgi:hypothetical protein